MDTHAIVTYSILDGIFPDHTGYAVAQESFVFVHIDVDTYQSAKDTFEWAASRLVVGGVIIFDDYGFMRCSGITRLVNEISRVEGFIFVHNLNGQAVFIKTK